MIKHTLKDNITKSIFTVLIGITYIGLFFPISISNIPLIILFVYCGIHLSPSKIGFTAKESLAAQVFFAMYFLQIIGLAYTENLSAGLFMLEKKISFLLVPLLVMPFLLAYKIDQKLILKNLGIITVASSILLFLIAFYRKHVLNDPNAFYFESFRSFEGFTPIHYVYYAMYFGCGSLILIDSLYETWAKYKFGRIGLILLYSYSLGIMTLVASKTGIGIFLFATLAFLFFKIQNKKVVMLSFFTIGLLLFLLVSFNENTRSRFKGLTDNLAMVTNGDLVKDSDFNGLNMRLIFWKIQVSKSWEDRIFLTGVGTGDNQNYIDSLYRLPQYKLSSYVGFDSHNQWVYTLVQVGIFGVLLMGILYVCYFAKAIHQVDVKFICFLIITFGFSLTESILETNKGILFFTFFFSIMSVNHLSLTKNSS